MEILATPESAADDLSGYDFARRYVTIPAGDGLDLRVHLVDAGDPDAPVVVFLHGNPSWSYLWRHQIAAVVTAGYRAVAPDLVGMGLSDKPAESDDYTVERHVGWMRALLFDALDLTAITFVLHDWGGIIGLRLTAEEPDRVARMAVSNTGLPERDPAEPLPDDLEPAGPYADFQRMAREVERWEPWTLLPMVTATEPSAEVVAGYRAPYPEPGLTIGSRAFTQLLPTRPDNPMLPDNFEAWKVLERFDRPVVTIFGAVDVVAPDGWRPLVERIPGAVGQPHVILEGGGHFCQEDVPEAFTDALLAWLGPPATRARDDTTGGRTADAIPVAHTPPGGYGDDLPPPVLAGCTEPLVDGAPDLRGWWEVTRVQVDGAAEPDHRLMGLRQRIEQCGDRFVVTSGGVVHDGRADGTRENGVDDVAEIDYETPITVVATYEDGVHVLRPVGLPVEVTRTVDGDELVWVYAGVVTRSRYLGPPDQTPPTPDGSVPTERSKR